MTFLLFRLCALKRKNIIIIIIIHANRPTVAKMLFSSSRWVDMVFYLHILFALLKFCAQVEFAT